MMMMKRVGAHAVVDDVVDLKDGLELGVDDTSRMAWSSESMTRACERYSNIGGFQTL